MKVVPIKYASIALLNLLTFPLSTPLYRYTHRPILLLSPASFFCLSASNKVSFSSPVSPVNKHVHLAPRSFAIGCWSKRWHSGKLWINTSGFRGSSSHLHEGRVWQCGWCWMGFKWLPCDDRGWVVGTDPAGSSLDTLDPCEQQWQGVIHPIHPHRGGSETDREICTKQNLAQQTNKKVASLWGRLGLTVLQSWRGTVSG